MLDETRTSGWIVQNALRDWGRQNVTYFLKNVVEFPVAIAKAAAEEVVDGQSQVPVKEFVCSQIPVSLEEPPERR